MAVASSRHGEANVTPQVRPDVALQREVDTMQAVYMQERRELEAQVREMENEVRRLQGVSTRLAQERGFSCSGVGSEICGLLRPRFVSWRLTGVDRMCWTGGFSGEFAQHDFILPECPGVDFSLCFGPLASEISHWELRLEAIGASDLQGLRLRAKMCVEPDSEDCTTDNMDPFGNGTNFPGADFKLDLNDGRCWGQVKCRGIWPSGAPSKPTVALCHAEVAVLGWDVHVIDIVSDWNEIAKPVDST